MLVLLRISRTVLDPMLYTRIKTSVGTFLQVWYRYIRVFSVLVSVLLFYEHAWPYSYRQVWEPWLSFYQIFLKIEIKMWRAAICTLLNAEHRCGNCSLTQWRRGSESDWRDSCVVDLKCHASWIFWLIGCKNFFTILAWKPMPVDWLLGNRYSTRTVLILLLLLQLHNCCCCCHWLSLNVLFSFLSK